MPVKLLLTLIPLAALSPAHAATVTLISSTAAGLPANGLSVWPAISEDGQVTVFESRAGDVGMGVALDDLWRFNESTWEELTPGYGGKGANGSSGAADLSPDGRYTVFVSQATNLLATPAPPGMVYVHDAKTGTLQLLSRQGGQAADSACFRPRISATGQVSFLSKATNLGNPNAGGGYQFYQANLLTGQLTAVLLGGSGASLESPVYDHHLSADGRYVTVNTVGNWIPGAGPQNHVFRGALPGSTGPLQWQIVDTSKSGALANGESYYADVTARGREVAFASAATNLLPADPNANLDVFVKNMTTGQVELISQSTAGVIGDWPSWEPAISADGRYVAFSSQARNLVPGDTNGARDIFLRDRVKQTTQRISVTSAGGQTHGDSSAPVISADGRYVAFMSDAPNIVPGDTNGATDVFLWKRGQAPTNVTSSHTPTALATNVPRRQPVTLTFTEPVNQPSAEQHFKLLDAAGHAVPGAFTWPNPKRTLQFAPRDPLPRQALATVLLRAGLLQQDGGTFTHAEEFAFVTGDGPAVIGWGPKGSTVTPGSNITVTFDEAMNQASVQNAFRLESNVPGVLSWNGNRLTFNPDANLAPGTTYAVTVRRHARTATGGRELGAPWSWTFHTADGASVGVLALTAAPTPAGRVQITVSSSVAGDLQVTILNVAGRAIAVLPRDDVAAGLSTLTWDRQSTRGLRAPSGRYLVSAQVRAATGVQVRALTALSLP
jgi:Tol biopolymer transport system component